MSRVVRKFTTRKPRWRPRVAPVDHGQLTPAQREALKETPSNTRVSDYLLVLAHDPEALSARTPLFNGIMYAEGGLSRAERELGAVGASFVNRCIYCAAVHAARYNQIAGDESVMRKLFFDGAGADVEPRIRAILSFAVKLSACPPELGPEDVAELKAQGLDMAEILDLAMATALFGWANRLMHTLGDPVEAG